jgi:hypothetical protein
MRKFLKTFASQVATGKYVSHSVNEANMAVVEYITDSALTAAQTITLTLPPGMDITPPVAASDVQSWVPHSVAAWSNANPRLKIIAADLLITSFDADTNVVVLTAAGGGLPDKCTVQLLCISSTLRTA